MKAANRIPAGEIRIAAHGAARVNGKRTTEKEATETHSSKNGIVAGRPVVLWL
jgi:hypothetical protein